MPLSTQEYKWVPANCWGNLTNCGEVTCDGLASRPGGVEILLAASCYGQQHEPVLASRLHLLSLKIRKWQVFSLGKIILPVCLEEIVNKCTMSKGVLSLIGRHGALMVSVLDSEASCLGSSSGWCCVLGQDTLLSQGYWRIKCWGVTQQWTSIPSRGESICSFSFHATETWLSSNLMSHLVFM